MPRFTILWHEMPAGSSRPSHWDLLLESADHLLTWELAAPPDSVVEQLARQLPDHRLVYLDYQGPLSNDRGHVQQWDTGEFQWREDTDDRLIISLAGQRMRGEVQLARDLSESVWSYRFRTGGSDHPS